MRRAALLGVCVTVAGCTTVTGGSTQPADTLGTTMVTTTTTAPALVPAASTTDKLLTRSELAAIVGDTDLTEVESYTEPDVAKQPIKPRECAYRAPVAETIGYLGTGRQAMVGNTNRGAPRGRVAAQLITAFENPHHGIHRRRAAERYTSRPIDLAPVELLLRLGQVVPIHLAAE